jgi:hypothetical protein
LRKVDGGKSCGRPGADGYRYGLNRSGMVVREQTLVVESVEVVRKRLPVRMRGLVKFFIEVIRPGV